MVLRPESDEPALEGRIGILQGPPVGAKIGVDLSLSCGLQLEAPIEAISFGS